MYFVCAGLTYMRSALEGIRRRGGPNLDHSFYAFESQGFARVVGGSRRLVQP